jgi:hypothetical protein
MMGKSYKLPFPKIWVPDYGWYQPVHPPNGKSCIGPGPPIAIGSPATFQAEMMRPFEKEKSFRTIALWALGGLAVWYFFIRSKR